MKKIDPNSARDRRKVILGLSGGVITASVLPKKWTKPVLDAVILPSHAQMTEMPPETTPEPTPTPTSTPPPCDSPVLSADNISVGGSLTMQDPSGDTSGGSATTQLTNASSVAVSLSNSLIVTPPAASINFTVVVPTQLQPGESMAITISTPDNMCALTSSITLEITAVSLDDICTGDVTISVPIGYAPAC